MEVLLGLAFLAGLVALPFAALNLAWNMLLYLGRLLGPLTRFAQERPIKWLRPELHLAALLAVIAMLAVAPLYLAPHGGSKDKNSGVQANAHTLQLALERYASEHGGSYPSSLGELFPAYMPGYPRTPWNTLQQPTTDIPASFTTYHPSMSALGKGRKAPPTQPTDYGAIGYARLGPGGRHYILTGTGRRNDDAVIVFAVSSL